MARPRSETKRTLILEAALLEFAENGLGAPTANIARRANVAAGTLFTYFATKEELQNALYLQLKTQVYGKMNDDFPTGATLQARLRHIWAASLAWASELPAKRKVSVQLHLSDALTTETREAAGAMSGPVAKAMRNLDELGKAHGLPGRFATAAMSSLQDAALNLLTEAPKRTRAKLIQETFDAFWRMVR